MSATYLDSKERRRTELRVPFSYRFSASTTPSSPRTRRFGAGRALYAKVDRAPAGAQDGTRARAGREGAALRLPRLRRLLAAEIAYVAPTVREEPANGPCGGTRDGLCEVYDTECIWSQAYERLKAYGEEESMLDGPVVVKDNALAGTSAWANTFLGRDHQARGKIDPSREE